MIAVRFYAVKRQFDLVYLDGKAIFSRSPTEHLTHERKVLTLLNNERMALKLKEGLFLTEIIDYLGHFVRSRRTGIAHHILWTQSAYLELHKIWRNSVHSSAYRTPLDALYPTFQD